MKTLPMTDLELGAKSPGSPVQRVSLAVQRGPAAIASEDLAQTEIVALAPKAPVRPPRRFVRLFQPRFAALVEAGKKYQTVRPVPVVMPRVGDLLDARAWTGLPYRSKTRALLASPSPICGVRSITIHFDGLIEIDGRYITPVEMESFAHADGFADRAELLAWFHDRHGLPFTGIVIDWLPF